MVTTQKDKGAVATDWYNLQLKMILNANPAVPSVTAIRLFAYSGISLYEAARFEIDNSRSLHGQLYQMRVMPKPDNNKKYSWVVSANAAMANVTRDLFPNLTDANKASIDSLEKAYYDKYISKAGEGVVNRSQKFGESIAAAIFDWSKSDLYDHANDPFNVPVFPGAWVPTPPLFLPPVVPYLENCRPFLRMHSHGTTLPPPKYSEKKGSEFYQMVNHVYKVSKTLTQEQKDIALFWNDAGVGIGYTPTGHVISIITQILQNSKASLSTAEEAYVKAGIAMWDAVIGCFRSKYKYFLLRPVSYIQQNIDANWLPLLGTPSHPEYPAAHAFVTSSVMEVLSSVFGKRCDFTDHTYDFLGYKPRSYNSLEQVAVECGNSRVYGGIHYKPSVDIGHFFGKSIGKDVIIAVQLIK